MNHLVPIQITLQAANAADARQLVQDLAGTIGVINLADIPAKTVVSTIDSVEKSKRNTTQKTEKQPEPEQSTDSDAPIPTDVDLRAAAQAVGKTPEGKAAIKALLAKYDVPNITGVPDDQRIAFKAELEAI